MKNFIDSALIGSLATYLRVLDHRQHRSENRFGNRIIHYGLCRQAVADGTGRKVIIAKGSSELQLRRTQK